MTVDFMVIVGFIIGGFILFFDSGRRDDYQHQNYWWAPFAKRRSKWFLVISILGLAFSWYMNFPELIYMFIALVGFFLTAYILLTIGLYIQRIKDFDESKRRDRQLESLRKTK